LAGVKNALALHEDGDSEGIEGRFPTEIQSVINLMNDLLRRNQKLIERTRKYVSKITHDINHPLAILKNGLKGDMDLDLLNRQVARMTGLVDRYASLARAIGPEGESRKKTDVAASLRDTADGFAILYRRTPLSIRCEVDDGLTYVIPQHDLEAVISNLVSNAHKYADSEILITAKIENGSLKIIVADDGPGIPPAQMKTALNWGKRLDEAPPGTGFGLSIVADILDLYDGSIQLSASSLGGLEATIRFPGPQYSDKNTDNQTLGTDNND
ncbi:MAG: HAMP domain-containing histidine kinase, partial [Sneathiella sp.]|nr:HAMP domain-containing histidine kinase [Sneathiella sp.]